MKFFWKCLGPSWLVNLPLPQKVIKWASLRETNGRFAVMSLVVSEFFWGKVVGRIVSCHGGILEIAIFQFWWVGLVVHYNDWSTYPVQADSEKNWFDVAISQESNGE